MSNSCVGVRFCGSKWTLMLEGRRRGWCQRLCYFNVQAAQVCGGQHRATELMG
jgi:hypothetical protein